MLFRATAKLLSAVSLPLSRQRLGGSTALFNLETTAQPQRHHYDQNPSRTSEEEKKTVPSGGCRTAVEAQAVVETLVAI